MKTTPTTSGAGGAAYIEPSADFLKAAFAGCTDDIPAIIGDEVLALIPELLEKHEGEIYVTPRVESGIAFLFGVQEDCEVDDFLEARVAPSAVMRKDRTNIMVWALDAPATDERAQPVADYLGMESLDEAIPVPPTGGWELVMADPERLYSLAELEATYIPETASEVQMYGDAKIITHYDESAPELQRSITVTVGGNRESKRWTSATTPIRALFSQLVSHRVGKKDGPALVLGDMVKGQRLKTSVKSLTAIGLDIDNGTPSAVIDEALTKLGATAIRYTTHSHGKTRTEIKKDTLIKFAPDDDVDTILIRKFLKEKEGWDQSVVDTAQFEGWEHETKGIVSVVTHKPIAKNRVIIPLLEQFDIAKEGRTQQEAMAKWGKIPEALANKLGIPFDKSGTDPSRLFYLPRHDEGRPFEISLFGGPLFDWRSLDLFDPYAELAEQIGKSKSKSVTEEGKKLGHWAVKRAIGFQIVDVLEAHCPDKIRGSASSHGKEIECPFDEDHSNAGDHKDRACFAVNAGEGSSEWFTVSCRHDCCRDKTNLDMLGKMVKDAWFPNEVLKDEQYNAVILEEGAATTSLPVAQTFTPTPGLKRQEEFTTSTLLAWGISVIEQLGLGLAFNILEQRAVLTSELLPWRQDVGRVVTDDVIRMIRHYLIEHAAIEFTLNVISEACLTLARHNSFHPVVDYLNSLKWDGVPRIDHWLATYGGVEDCGYTQAVGRKFLIAAVRRAKQPGIKFDNMMILEGAQGIGKSSLLKVLGGDFFSDAELGKLDNKDAPLALQGVWIFEIGELAVMYRANDLKAFVSRSEDRYRAPYERFARSFPRGCVFAGTTNDGAYLSDPTGNRRYWPVLVKVIDLNALKRDRDQLWAEAAALEAEGEPLHLPEDLWGEAATQQGARVEDDPWKEVIWDWLQTQRARRYALTKDLLSKALGIDPDAQQRLHSTRVRKVMTALGWSHSKAIRTPDGVFAGYVPPAK